VDLDYTHDEEDGEVQPDEIVVAVLGVELGGCMRYGCRSAPSNLHQK